MKKIFSILFICMMFSVLFLSCSKKTAQAENKLTIVCSIFPEYDWTKNILGEKASDIDLTLLMDSGVDPHSFQPSAADIIKIAACDMFVYVGGESDTWVKDALKNSTNKNQVAINLLEVLGENVKAEEVVEGMQEEDEHEHNHEAEEHDHDAEEHHHDEADEHHEAEEHHHEEVEYDEHVWLSLKNAKKLCTVIAERIAELDSTNAKTYLTNANSYIAKLAVLDKEYTDTVKNAKYKTVVFGDRFPFRYLVDDYDVDYYAAFIGCSAETEASFETVVFLAKKLDELNVGTILTIEGAQHKIAQTIVQNSKAKNQKVLVMDSMQSVTAKDVTKGVTYLSIMKDNLDVLKTALN